MQLVELCLILIRPQGLSLNTTYPLIHLLDVADYLCSGGFLVHQYEVMNGFGHKV